MNFLSPIEGATAVPLSLAVVRLSVVVLLGEQTSGKHTPDAAEHVHGGSVHHIVDLRGAGRRRSSIVGWCAEREREPLHQDGPRRCLTCAATNHRRDASI